MSSRGGAAKILLLGFVASLILMGGTASATLPGKNGPLLISTFIKDGSPNYSTYLYEQPMAGKAKRLLGSVEYSFYDGAVSPNGRQIVYSRYPGYQLWLGPESDPGKAKADHGPGSGTEQRRLDLRSRRQVDLLLGDLFHRGRGGVASAPV